MLFLELLVPVFVVGMGMSQCFNLCTRAVNVSGIRLLFPVDMSVLTCSGDP